MHLGKRVCCATVHGKQWLAELLCVRGRFGVMFGLWRAESAGGGDRGWQSGWGASSEAERRGQTSGIK